VPPDERRSIGQFTDLAETHAFLAFVFGFFVFPINSEGENRDSKFEIRPDFRVSVVFGWPLTTSKG
jgi:hypothetical protein